MDTFKPPLSIKETCMVCDDLNNILRPCQTSGIGYKDPGLDLMFQGRLKDMVMFLWAYINPQSAEYAKWMAASLCTVNNMDQAPLYACQF